MMLRTFLILALALRVAIPGGLMPNGDDWYLKICPDGLPPEIAAVFGDEHAHHAHHAHHQDDEPTFTQCELNTVLVTDLALGFDPTIEQLDSEEITSPLAPVLGHKAFRPSHPSTRGPPTYS